MAEPYEKQANSNGYWKANLRLVVALLSLWMLVSYGLSILFVIPLNQIRIAGFPLGFWFAHQGTIYVFLLLILIYAVTMDRIDARYEVD